MWSRLAERIDDLLLLMSISLMFGIVRTVMQPAARTVRFCLAMFFVSVPVGTLAGRIAQDAGFSDSACFAVTAAASLMAQEIVGALIDNNHLVSEIIESLVKKLMK